MPLAYLEGGPEDGKTIEIAVEREYIEVAITPEIGPPSDYSGNWNFMKSSFMPKATYKFDRHGDEDILIYVPVGSGPSSDSFDSMQLMMEMLRRQQAERSGLGPDTKIPYSKEQLSGKKKSRDRRSIERQLMEKAYALRREMKLSNHGKIVIYLGMREWDEFTDDPEVRHMMTYSGSSGTPIEYRGMLLVRVQVHSHLNVDVVVED